EPVLDLGPLEREIAVPEGEDVNALRADAFQEIGGACARLNGAGRVGAEHHPPDLEIRRFLDQAQDRAAAADLDVVGMGAETEEPQRTWAVGRKSETQHGGPPLR